MNRLTLLLPFLLLFPLELYSALHYSVLSKDVPLETNYLVHSLSFYSFTEKEEEKLIGSLALLDGCISENSKKDLFIILKSSFYKNFLNYKAKKNYQKILVKQDLTLLSDIIKKAGEQKMEVLEWIARAIQDELTKLYAMPEYARLYKKGLETNYISDPALLKFKYKLDLSHNWYNTLISSNYDELLEVLRPFLLYELESSAKSCQSFTTLQGKELKIKGPASFTHFKKEVGQKKSVDSIEKLIVESTEMERDDKNKKSTWQPKDDQEEPLPESTIPLLESNLERPSSQPPSQLPTPVNDW